MIEHPLISNIDDLTLEEIQTRISDLTKKLNWASRSGNANLTSQIRLALDTFRSKYSEKQQAIYKEATKNNPTFADKIDIS